MTTITLSAAASAQDITDAYNTVTHLTGIRASVNGSSVDFTSDEYGSDAIIKNEASTGTFVTSSGNSAQGTDEIATIDGQLVVADGTTFTFNNSEVALKVRLDPAANGVLSPFVVSAKDSNP